MSNFSNTNVNVNVNENSNTEGPLSDATLQRLVDGELSPEAYRSVLRALEAEPQHWRRCALLFLEDQALGRDLGIVRHESEVTPSRVGVAAAGPVGSGRGHFWAALVAGFLLAFLGGYYVRSELQQFRAPPRVVPASLAGREAPAPRPEPGPQAPRGGQPALDPEYLTLVVDGADGDEPQRIELPIYPWQDAPLDWADNANSAIPPHVREALERLGGKIKRDHYWAPTTLSDGRQVLIPLERVEITPPLFHPVSY